MTSFFQTPPRLPDAWTADRILRETLLFHLGEQTFDEVKGDLATMGERVTDPEVLGLAAKAEGEPPVHVPYSATGERIDEIRVSDAYVELGKIGIEAGVTALPYEGSDLGESARVVWAGLIMLWGPSSALYSCPVAMTDAAARTLLVHGGVGDVAVVERLTSRDPSFAWTSGQWMTETAGGSDVGRTETIARLDPDGTWRLSGLKWFTSATTSEMALTLARPAGAPDGSKGLGLFRIHRYLDDGSRNSIVVRRLKDKLGTRALPTAELELNAAVAHAVGDPMDGGGVRRIATMLNLTRIHNGLGAAGALARALTWARAYARVRDVFGKPLHTMPAHRATLTDLAVDYAAALALVIRCCEITGRVEHNCASEAEAAVLRGLTPITKLATAKWAVAGTTEAMEAMGGLGYCEDSMVPAMVRNAHVLPIWEGTTNVLALDLLRAEQRDGAFEAVMRDAAAIAGGVSDDASVAEPARAVLDSVAALRARSGTITDAADAQAGARSLAMGAALTYACARLCAQGAWAAGRGDPRTAAAARRLAQRGLVPARPPEDLTLGMEDEAPTETLR